MVDNRITELPANTSTGTNTAIDLGGSSDTFTYTTANATDDAITVVTSDIENAPFDLTVGSIALTNSSFGSLIMSDMYKGCERCSYFSSQFGHLESEEIFEIRKAEFVEHFNKKHRDILMKKGLPQSKKKFTEVEGSSWAREYTASFTTTVSGTGGTFFDSTDTMDSLVASVPHHIENVYGIPVIVSDEPIYDMSRPEGDRGSRVPEYEVVNITTRHLDRQARFRAERQV
jgi:hypothetical protein